MEDQEVEQYEEISTSDCEREDNIKLWRSVEKTPTSQVKGAKMDGRSVKSVKAHYQRMRATEIFGPVGEGWGYETEYGFIESKRGELFVWCDLTLWFSPFGSWEGMPARDHRRSFGPIRGLAVVQGIKLEGEKWKASDHDASKKAMTDALTKGFSHLGFNADVFLGKFDDNKYVEGLRKDKKKEETAAEQAYQQDRQKFIDSIKICKKPEDMDKVLADNKLWMARLPAGKQTEMRAWVEKQKAELK